METNQTTINKKRRCTVNSKYNNKNNSSIDNVVKNVNLGRLRNSRKSIINNNNNNNNNNNDQSIKNKTTSKSNDTNSLNINLQEESEIINKQNVKSTKNNMIRNKNKQININKNKDKDKNLNMDVSNEISDNLINKNNSNILKNENIINKKTQIVPLIPSKELVQINNITDVSLLYILNEKPNNLAVSFLYKPFYMLPDLSCYINDTIEIRISSEYLSVKNKAYNLRKLYGTDYYTSNSDIVLIVQHMGYLSIKREIPKNYQGISVYFKVLKNRSSYNSSLKYGLKSMKLTNYQGHSIKPEGYSLLSSLGTTEELLDMSQRMTYFKDKSFDVNNICKYQSSGNTYSYNLINPYFNCSSYLKQNYHILAKNIGSSTTFNLYNDNNNNNVFCNNFSKQNNLYYSSYEPPMVLNLSYEVSYKYCIGALIDRSYDNPKEYLSYKLKSQVLYLETDIKRYEISRLVTQNNNYKNDIKKTPNSCNLKKSIVCNSKELSLVGKEKENVFKDLENSSSQCDFQVDTDEEILFEKYERFRVGEVLNPIEKNNKYMLNLNENNKTMNKKDVNYVDIPFNKNKDINVLFNNLDWSDLIWGNNSLRIKNFIIDNISNYKFYSIS